MKKAGLTFAESTALMQDSITQIIPRAFRQTTRRNQILCLIMFHYQVLGQSITEQLHYITCFNCVFQHQLLLTHVKPWIYMGSRLTAVIAFNYLCTFSGIMSIMVDAVHMTYAKSKYRIGNLAAPSMDVLRELDTASEAGPHPLPRKLPSGA